jgi:hypothetical protein
MEIALDAVAVRAAFSQPDPDGAFRGPFADYLHDLGRRRPVLMFAFAPKAAGTFLRAAAVEAVDGQLVRTVHAQGGRDAQLYLPVFVHYYLGGLCDGPLVAHVHMQALPANRRFLEAFEIHPVIMLRPVADMLASFLDMLNASEEARRDGLNCTIPADFTTLSRREQADFAIDMLAPWYASYFATWAAYAREMPDLVCVLHYRDLLADPAGVLETALTHAGLRKDRAACETALAKSWSERDTLRFNKGVAGRGREYFTWQHFARLSRMLDYHHLPDAWREQLF